jgi:uncharacterized protein (TIGR02246 family)
VPEAVDVDAIRDAVADAGRRHVAAAMAADTDALGDLIADDVLYAHSDGIPEDKDSYLRRVASGVYLTIAMDHTVDHIRVLGDDVAVVRGTTVSNSTPESAYRMDNLKAYILDVWAHRDGRWQLVEHHVTLADTRHG